MPDLTMKRSSSTCLATTRAMWHSILNSSSTSAPTGPRFLAVWGKNDPFFLPAGAEAFKRDNPDAEIHLLNAGHFAVEREGPEIAAIIRDFLARKPPKQASSSSNSTNLTFETRAPPRGLLRSTGNGVKAVSLRGAHGSAPGVARG